MRCAAYGAPLDHAGEVRHPEAEELPDDVLEAVVQQRLGAVGGTQVQPRQTLAGTGPAVLVEQAQDLQGVPALARDGDPFPSQESRSKGRLCPTTISPEGQRFQGHAEFRLRDVNDAQVQSPHEQQIGDAID